MIFDIEDLQAAVELISVVLMLMGASGIGGLVMIFYRLGQSKQLTISTLKSIEQRLEPLENWRERRGSYMTKDNCEKEHDELGRRLEDRLAEFVSDIEELKADRKTMMRDISELKVMVSECLIEIRIRNER